MVNENVLNGLLKDGKEVNVVMQVGRLFHARATVTRNDRSPMVLSTESTDLLTDGPRHCR